jgi:anti-sigma factor RsiW
VNNLARWARRTLGTLLGWKPPSVMTCAELEEFIVDYLDGRLSLWQRTKFWLHLTLCPKCRAYLDSYQNAVTLGKKVFARPDRPAAEEAPEAFIQAILSSRPK